MTLRRPPSMAGNDTIAAIATAAGSGGIGIIRISGERGVEIARKLFQPAAAPKDDAMHPRMALKSHHLSYGRILDPGHGQLLDEVLVAYMPAPHSYTREDVVEIQCHGGSAVLQEILALVLSQGARLAEPGEFTRRAFLSGRIDLTQAEAVADLINARSESALKMAARQLEGGLKARIGALRDAVTDILAEIEAELEFGEEGASGISEGNITGESIMDQVIKPMRSLLDSYRYGRVLREGFRVSIVGRPNVGKSSLLNRLLDQEKAIVTPFPGTTRDPVEGSVNIGGVPVDIIDTAGMHASHDPVECIGIQKSHEALAASDLALFVIEAQQAPDAEDDRILAQLKGRRLLLVINKVDLVQNGCPVPLPDGYQKHQPICISARNGAGIPLLKSRIAAFWSGEGEGDNNIALRTLRQKLAIEDAMEDAQRAAEGLDQNRALDMVVMDLGLVLKRLQLLSGEGAGVDVLDAIFQKFCIGK